MGLVSKTVMVKWNGKTRRYYESLGYSFTKIGDEFEVSVDDLQKKSTAKVECKCDGCGKELDWTYATYNDYVRDCGSTYCRTCGGNLYRSGRAFSKSFYNWCIENNRQDILLRWDYDLNECSPNDVNYGSNKKYWFKCNKHPYHHSELKMIDSITSGKEGCIACKQCNSIAQYIIDNFPNKDLYDVWDKDKNGEINPWSISRGSRSKKYWFICQEKDYHGSYEMRCNDFNRGHRCPYCSNNHGKVHPKDSLGQYIIDNYNEEFLHNIWSEKNNISPFKLSRNSSKRVWWKCQEDSHKDYMRECNASFKAEFRCPKCVAEMKESIIEKKTKSYLEELGFHVLTEYECSIRAVNPKNKYPMPYDNEITLYNGKHLIIEVHGDQHYDAHYYTTLNKCSYKEAEEKLKQRKLYDRYKKYIAWKNNYEYLEIPNMAFRGKNKDLYKQMIDNKIKEILEKEEIA